jgi:hypothetical protein
LYRHLIRLLNEFLLVYVCVLQHLVHSALLVQQRYLRLALLVRQRYLRLVLLMRRRYPRLAVGHDDVVTSVRMLQGCLFSIR